MSEKTMSEVSIRLNMDEIWGYDGETIGDLLRGAVREAVTAEVKKIAKGVVVKHSKDLERVISEEVKKISRLKVVP